MNILQFLIDIRSRDLGATAQVARVQESLDRAASSAGRLSASLGGKLRQALHSLPGADFFTNPAVALAAGTAAVAKMGMDAGRTAVSFEVLLGSGKKAARMLGEMDRYAANSPFDRLGVQEAASTMLGFGVEAGKVMPSLRMLGDIAMGDNRRFQGLALVFAQVAAAGKLQGQDLLQLISNGYNPLLDISRLTGKSVAELREEMSEGNISFELMRRAMEAATSEGGKFHGMVDRINRTPFGRFGQMADQAKETLLQLYEVIEPLLIPAFAAVQRALSALQPLIAGAAQAMGWLVRQFREGNPLVIAAAAAAAAYAAVASFSAGVLKGWTVAQWLHVTALIAAEKAQKLLNIAMTLNPVGLVVAGIAALVAVVVTCWNRFAGFRAFLLTAWDTLKGFGGAIKQYVTDRLAGILEGLGAIGRAVKALVRGDFSQAWEEARQGASKIYGIDAARRLRERTAAVWQEKGNTYAARLERERRKQQEKEASGSGIPVPEAAAGVLAGNPAGGNAAAPGGLPAGGSPESTAEAIATGGTRTASVTVNIQKFFDTMNVTMAAATDTAALERIVLECMNRSIETAMSAAR